MRKIVNIIASPIPGEINLVVYYNISRSLFCVKWDGKHFYGECEHPEGNKFRLGKAILEEQFIKEMTELVKEYLARAYAEDI